MWLACALSGCSLALDTSGVRPEEADIRLPDPAVFQAAELFAGETIGDKQVIGLLEGAGWRFDGDGAAKGTEPIPLYLAQLTDGDDVSVTIPSEFSESWEICGRSVQPGASIRLSPLDAPCLRGATAIGFTVAIPVDPTVGQSDAVGPLVITITGLDRSDTIEVPVVALDEIAGEATRADGLYSHVAIKQDYVPIKTSSAIAWKSVSDMHIEALVDASGSPGEGTVSCSKSGGCGGGFAGPGSPGGGLGNGGSSSTSCAASRCDAPSERGGQGAAKCDVFNCSTPPRQGAGGGGGGNAAAGDKGVIATASCGDVGNGGSGDSSDRMLVNVDKAWGGGGGAGGTLTVGSGPTYLGGGGGGGGGIIDLTTLGNLHIGSGALVTARGGHGGGPATDVNACNGNKTVALGGGGAGGAVRIRAEGLPSVEAVISVIDVRGGPGGDESAMVDSGAGSVGRARLDGRSSDGQTISFPSGVRGPELDRFAPIMAEDTLTVLVRGNDALEGELVSFAHRAFGADSYVLGAETSASGAITIDIPLEPGLNEVCVLVEPQDDPALDAIPDGAKHCAWVGYVEGATP